MFLYYYFEKVIPAEICDNIIQKYDNKLSISTIMNDSENIVDSSTRNVLSTDIDAWERSFIHYYGYLANNINYKYDVTELSQCNFLKYCSKMFYKPHLDTSFNLNHPSFYRKLSVVLQLNDDYEGGDFILYGDTMFDEIILPKTKGTIIVFPSNRYHEVKEITSGNRYSIIGWLSGNHFR